MFQHVLDYLNEMNVVIFVVSMCCLGFFVILPNLKLFFFIIHYFLIYSYFCRYILNSLIRRTVVHYCRGVFVFFRYISYMASYFSFLITLVIIRFAKSSWDYFLLYDIFLCTGCILAIWKIFYFFQLIKGLGGSVISVGRCISTVYNYLIVMGVIMFSFAVGINLLVQPYLGNVETRDGVTKTMGSHFKDIGFTFRNLYWAFYGYLDPQLYPLIVGNSGPNQIPVDHFITSFAIECIISLYHGIIIVTLLNLMVSLLVKKADEVLENEESEFKYTRIVIYSEFLDWSSAVPPPFNLLLIIKQLFVCLMSRNYEMCWPEIFIDRSIIKPKPEIAEKDCAVYEVHLMLKLFSRFRASKECHYKTIYRTEFDKDKQSETLAKVAFMNSTHREIDPAFKLRNMKTKNGSKIAVLPSTNPICKTTRRA
uniref:Ion_trans domain-containing protein n=1 Tax=Heterorhabditis bacteriophora TaxID=37862 RepID=A0A1I7XKN7_HETBA